MQRNHSKQRHFLYIGTCNLLLCLETVHCIIQICQPFLNYSRYNHIYMVVIRRKYLCGYLQEQVFFTFAQTQSCFHLLMQFIAISSGLHICVLPEHSAGILFAFLSFLLSQFDLFCPILSVEGYCYTTSRSMAHTHTHHTQQNSSG